MARCLYTCPARAVDGYRHGMPANPRVRDAAPAGVDAQCFATIEFPNPGDGPVY